MDLFELYAIHPLKLIKNQASYHLPPILIDHLNLLTIKTQDRTVQISLG